MGASLHRKIGEAIKKMKILILCEASSAPLGIETKNIMASSLLQVGHFIETVIVDSKKLKPCMGCVGCWLKTPGQCVITSDEVNSIAQKQINADAIIIISKITFGGFSADIKAFLDRSIQNIMPFFASYNNEIHHPARYKHFPAWVAIGYGNVSKAEQQTFTQLAVRNALNMHPKYHTAITISRPADITANTQGILAGLEACV